MIRKRVRVLGEVQGVGFRFHTQAVAARLRVAGFVRNLPDGSVEVEAEGDGEAVGRLVDWLRSGPAWASVESLQVDDLTPVGERGFRIEQ
jgi:acylphosphatase